MAKLRKSLFRFRRHESIGTEGAEEDSEYLIDCFVDTGDLETLRDTSNPRCIVVGRTGTGKTALLTLLQQREQHVSIIEPDQLSLQYISNSSIIRHLDRLGVNLDLFYRLLWKHVLVVELIQLRYHLRTESDQRNFLERIRERLFGDKKKTEALNYLIQWGERFWVDTELRIQEVTTTLENQVKASLGAKLSLLEGSAGETQSCSLEDRKEIIHRAQDVVNHVQIGKLTEITKILAQDVFDDPQQRFYIVIDRLDENWVADTLRYRLIRSLVETVKDLRTIKTAKVIVAIRKDLIARVFRYTRDPGFQEEKYQQFFLPLNWTPTRLLEVVDRRLNKLVQRQYSGTPVTYADLFPRSIGKTPTADYLVERTLRRPRDIIQFTNCCIDLAADRPDITVTIVREAESEYSRRRLRSLADEWAADYPRLLDATTILLRQSQPILPISAISDEVLFRVASHVIDFPPLGVDRMNTWSTEYLEDKLPMDDFRRRLVRVLYETGTCGLRATSGSPTSWSFIGTDAFHEADIAATTRLVVSPMLYRVLGIPVRE